MKEALKYSSYKIEIRVLCVTIPFNQRSENRTMSPVIRVQNRFSTQPRWQTIIKLPSLSSNCNKNYDCPAQQRTLSTASSQAQYETNPVPETLDFSAFSVEVRFHLSHLAELLELAVVRRVTDVDELLHPVGSGGDGTTVGKGVEGGFASVGALPGISYATKSESWDRAVEKGVIDGCSSGGDLVEDWILLAIDLNRLSFNIHTLVCFGLGTERIQP